MKNGKKILVSILAFVPVMALAVPFTDWTASDVYYMADALNDQVGYPPLDPSGTGRDLRALYYRYYGGYHYFRLDLHTPINHAFSSEFAEAYFIYLDMGPGGSNINHPYLAAGVTNIMDAIDIHSQLAVGFTVVHRHPWNGSTFLTQAISTPPFPNSTFQATEDYGYGVGASLEWRLNASLYPFAGLTRLWAGSVNTTIGMPDGLKYDTLGPLDLPVIPEPGTFVLAGVMGVMAIGARRFLVRRSR